MYIAHGELSQLHVECQSGVLGSHVICTIQLGCKAVLLSSATKLQLHLNMQACCFVLVMEQNK